MAKLEGGETDSRLREHTAIVESSADAILAKNLDGVITSWNPGAERIFGYTFAEAVGRHVDLIIPARLRDEEASIRRRVQGGETVSDYETVRQHKDGSLIDVSVIICPIRNTAGGIVGVSKIARNITARKFAEGKLHAALWELTNFKTALDEHAIVAITNPSGDITYVNDKFCEISKYSRRELIGQNHRIINSGHHPREFFTGLWRTIAEGRVWKGEIKNRAKDGTYYWVATTIVPFLNDRGKPDQYVAVRSDITAQKNAAEVLERRGEELLRSNNALEEFAYVASHDLQEPLRGISGCIQLLRDRYQGKLDASADEFIRHSVANAERMQALILGLLDYARVDRKGGPFEPVDTGQAAREAVAGLEVAIEESGAQVSIGNLPMLTADRVQLRRLFQNLISNAIKFRRDGPPEIAISAAPGAEGWTFAVSDNGIGIEPRHAERIFGMFQRLHRREAYPGNGIGLALCRRIVERHGGRIWVESEPEKGSTFHFTLS